MPHRPTSAVPALGLALALATLAVPACQGADLAWKGLTPQVVLSGLGGPIDFAVAPDGTVWWNEYYTGNVTRFDPRDGSRRVVFHADPIPSGVERGLVGLALDPDVVDNGVFYVYYTVADPEDAAGGTNRLSRIEGETETVLLTLPAFRLHNGGRIVFAKDGSMFVSTGENDKGAPAQDPESLLGKTLHLFPDGRPAPGNVRGFVYDLGHRNVYGLAYDAEQGRLFSTENGNAERDEVNLIEAGRNYGWPFCEGNVRFEYALARDTDEPCDDPRFTPPIGEFYPERTAAPTGAAIFQGQLLWASWNEGAIHRMTQDPEGRWVDDVLFRPGGRINDLEVGPDGRSVYYSNWTHVLRLDIPDHLARLPALASSAIGGEVAAATENTPGPPTAWLLLALLGGAAAGFRRRSD